MKIFIVKLFILLVFINFNFSYAIECNNHYVVSRGDTLSKIARDAYGKANFWQFLYQANGDALGSSPSIIQIGAKIWIPCINKLPANGNKPRSEVGLPTGKGDLKIELLTASDYRPFTDRSWVNGGMITEIIEKAFKTLEGNNEVTFRIQWINDWNAHLDPLLKTKKYDMGFPWLKPNCSPEIKKKLGENMLKRCEFLFSEPLFNMLTVLYEKTGKNSRVTSPDDLHNKIVCRPTGYYTFDLEEVGLSTGKNYTLFQPNSIADCFRRLVNGEVDFVSVNNFSGLDAKQNLDDPDSVKQLGSDSFITEQSLHLVIHKTHPQAHILIHRFNKGLKSLKESGDLAKIKETHLELFYGQFLN